MQNLYDEASKITFYRDELFRSRLEARWAVFFDLVGIDWEYEPRTFSMNDGGLYTPDFFLKDLGWIEIKPTVDHLDVNPKYATFGREIREYDIAREQQLYFAFSAASPYDRDRRSGLRTIILIQPKNELTGFFFIRCPVCDTTVLAKYIKPGRDSGWGNSNTMGLCGHGFEENYQQREMIDRAFDFAQSRSFSYPKPMSQSMIETLQEESRTSDRRMVDICDDLILRYRIELQEWKDGFSTANGHRTVKPEDVRLFIERERVRRTNARVRMHKGETIVHHEYGEGIVVARDLTEKVLYVRFADAERELSEGEIQASAVNYPEDS